MHWAASHAGLEDLVASSAKFRSLTGAANATAAEDYIFYGGAPAGTQRPFALITVDGGDVRDVIATSAAGSLVLSLEVPKSEYAELSTAKTKFAAFLADIDTMLGEMRDNSRTRAVSWNISEVESLVPPHLKEDFETDEPDDPYYAASFLIRWV